MMLNVDKRNRAIRRGVRQAAKVLAVVAVLALVAICVVAMPAAGWAALGFAAVGVATAEKLKVKITAEKGWQDPGGTSHAKGAVIDLDADKAATLIECKLAEEIATEKTVGEEAAAAVAAYKNALAEAAVAAFREAATGFEIAGKRVRITGGHENWEDDPRLGYKGFDDFVGEVRQGSQPGQVMPERLGKVVAYSKQHGMHEGMGAEGGFLVPPDFSNRLLERAEGVLDILGECDVIQTRTNAVDVTAYIDHDRSGTTYRYAGIVPYWPGEGAQITRSHPLERLVHIQLHKLVCLVPLTDEIIEDTDGLASRLEMKMGEALGEEAVHSILFGTGVGQPLGMFTGAEAGTDHGFYAVAKETGQAAASIVSQNVLKMFSSLYKGQGRFLYNPEAFIQLASMTIDVGTAGVPVWLPANGLANQPNETIFGLRADRTDLCAALGTMGDIVAINPSAYLLARKGGVKTAVSIHLWFDYDETALRATFRIGGMPAWDRALTPRKGSLLRSPFMAVRARA